MSLRSSEDISKHRPVSA